MNAAELAIREALHELADEGRPVPLGCRALASVRRRRARRARLGAAGVALALAAGVVPRLFSADAPPAEPPASLAGRSVTAAYHTYTDVRVLNPATGRYRSTGLSVETVSADLRFAAGTGLAGYVATYPEQDPRLGVLDTRTGDLDWLPMPHHVKHPAWAPDGYHLVAQVADERPPRAVLIDPVRAETTVISLAVPAEHLLLRLCWSNAQRLLAVTAPRPGTAGHGTAQSLLELDTYGQVVRQLSIPDSWQVTCAGRRGRVPLTRLAEARPEAAVVPPEVAVADLGTGTVSPPVRLPWAGAIEVVGWRSPAGFVAVSRDELLAVDLARGTAARVPGPPLCPDPSQAIFLPGDGLTRYAAEVADKSF